MILGQQLINDNGISGIALAFFTALFALVGTLAKLAFDDRKERRNEARIQQQQLADAIESARIAAKNAEEARTNTKNVSNGFAGGVLAKLERLSEQVSELAISQQKHLLWHQENEKEK